MSIHHFGVLAGYSLWLYILLCLVATALAFCFHQLRLARKKKQIQDWFQNSLPCSSAKICRKLKEFSRSDLLMECILQCYEQNQNAYSADDLQKVQLMLLEMLHLRIFTDQKQTAMDRCLLLSYIQRCGLTSNAIEHFVDDCTHRSALEQRWAESAIKTQHQQLHKEARECILSK